MIGLTTVTAQIIARVTRGEERERERERVRGRGVEIVAVFILEFH